MYQQKETKKGSVFIIELFIIIIFIILVVGGLKVYSRKQHANTFNFIVESNCKTIQTLIFVELASSDYETVKDSIFDTGGKNIFGRRIENPATGLIQTNNGLPGERGYVVVTCNDDSKTFYINGNGYDNTSVFEDPLIANIKTFQQGSSVVASKKNTLSSKESGITEVGKESTTSTEYYNKSDSSIPQIIKNNARDKWGNNTEMVNYEIQQQMNAYNWYLSENSYPSILNNARDKWGNNFEMVKYEYEEQLSAYKWIETYNDYPNIMSNAKQKWGNNYNMVKYEYEEQVNAYEWLQKNKDKDPRAFKNAINKWGDNYTMVKYEFEEMCK